MERNIHNMTFRIGKLYFELSFPLVAVMTAVIIFDTAMSVIICFIAVIIHESGHLATLKHYNSFPEKIKLTLFDIAIIDKKKYSRSTKQELVVVLAGVAMNFISAVIFYILYILSDMMFFKNLFLSSLTLGFFNLLPVDTLDGGQALFLILSSKLTLQRAELILNIVSFVILIPVACIGFLVLLQSKYNFTLLLTALYLIAIILLKRRKA